MKRIVSLIIVALIALALVGCGSKTTETPKATETPQQTTDAKKGSAAAEEKKTDTKTETPKETAASSLKITTQPTDVTVTEGAKATFKVVADGATEYKWYYQKPDAKDWTAVKTDGAAATYTVKTEARHNGYKYKCVVSNATGKTETNAVTLTVNAAAKPEITTQPADATVKEGSTATFKVAATGAKSYKWYYQKPGSTEWTAVKNNGTSDTYTVKTEIRHNGYKYKCVVSNAGGKVESSVATLTVTAIT